MSAFLITLSVENGKIIQVYSFFLFLLKSFISADKSMIPEGSILIEFEKYEEIFVHFQDSVYQHGSSTVTTE